MNEFDKVQQLFEEEQELLTDFSADLEEAKNTKEHSKAFAVWAMQTTRVKARLRMLSSYWRIAR